MWLVDAATGERADLRGINIDYAYWPLWCGSFGVKVDDRIIAQLICHLTRVDDSDCSGGVKEAMEHIRAMAISDLFCEYRDDVKPLYRRENTETELTAG